MTNKLLKTKLLCMMLSIGCLVGCGKGEGIEPAVETEPIETIEAEGTTMDESPLEETVGQQLEPVEEVEAQQNDSSMELQDNPYGPYKDTLIDIYKHIGCQYQNVEAAYDGETGIAEHVMGTQGIEILSEIGYLVEDISGDGVPELIVGMIDGPFHMPENGKDIYAVYTIKDNQVEQVVTGWARNRYVYLGNGRFYYCGSGGAMYSSIATYHLSQDGTALVCEDYYFSHETNAEMTEYGFFHNQTGEFDVTVSEALDITDEEFWELEKELLSKKQDFSLIPFQTIDDAERENLLIIDSILPVVEASYATEALEYVASIQVDDSEYASDVVFKPSNDVTDFHLNALEFVSIEEDGKMSFAAESLLQLDVLKQGEAVLASIEFGETIPRYGISYVEANGTECHYAVAMSGEDGSVVLMEY